MPSEFDRLVADINTKDRADDLTPNQAVTFVDSLMYNLFGLRPDERRAVDDALAKALSAPLIGDGEDDELILAAAQEGQARSDRDAAVKDRAAQKKPAPSMAELKKSVAEVRRQSNEMTAAMRKMQRDQKREQARETLAKALSAFHRGELTGHQVATIESMVHRNMALAARMGGGQ
jgi:hypothetical protein